MTCGIYQIVNSVNGKRYVGSSVNIERRWKAHLRELRAGKHHAGHLQNAWNKYGEDAFSIHVIIECSKGNLILEEQKELDSGYDYNSSPTAGNTLGLKFSDDARDRVRKSRKRMLDEDPEGYRARMSSISKGRPKPDHWRQKMSDLMSNTKRHGEWVRAMEISRAELTKDKVLEVRGLRLNGKGLDEIANITGVSWSQCQRICAGERYQWAYDYSGPVPFDKYASRRRKKAPE